MRWKSLHGERGDTASEILKCLSYTNKTLIAAVAQLGEHTAEDF